MSIDINYGSRKVVVNITELKSMKSTAENLASALIMNTPTAVAGARSVADSALREYGALVCNKANTVLTQCHRLSNSNKDALDELEVLIEGLDGVITGYLKLEQELASTSVGVRLT